MITSPRPSPISPAHDEWVPLFLLNFVLFPGGILPLKVFETRYIDMLRECMKREIPFGVVHIKSGKEIGMLAEPEMVGCLATIENWDMEQPGILLLRTQGEQRFRILQTRVVHGDRLEAQIEMIAADVTLPISEMHVQCAKALKIVIDDINSNGRHEKGEAFESPFEENLQYDQSGWVANRWCEILKISPKARQKLLEVEDAQSRLTIIYQYLQQHKII